MKLYDDIAEIYHLIYHDWEASIERQGQLLDGLLERALGKGPHRILDVACGIGTQSLGLAALGHSLTASDLSPASVERARREARQRGLAIEVSVADMCECDRHHAGTFDAVIACDNSVPHLQTTDELLRAFRAFYCSTRPGGVTLITVRDYGVEERSELPRMVPFGVRDTPEGRWMVFQVWDWDVDGARYDFTMYFVGDSGAGAPQVLVSKARYFAVDTVTLSRLLEEAGFQGVERIDGEFFQPVLLARRGKA